MCLPVCLSVYVQVCVCVCVRGLLCAGYSASAWHVRRVRARGMAWVRRGRERAGGVAAWAGFKIVRSNWDAQVFKPAFVILQNHVKPKRFWIVVRGTYSVEDIMVLVIYVSLLPVGLICVLICVLIWVLMCVLIRVLICVLIARAVGDILVLLNTAVISIM